MGRNGKYTRGSLAVKCIVLRINIVSAFLSLYTSAYIERAAKCANFAVDYGKMSSIVFVLVKTYKHL